MHSLHCHCLVCCHQPPAWLTSPVEPVTYKNNRLYNSVCASIRHSGSLAMERRDTHIQWYSRPSLIWTALHQQIWRFVLISEFVRTGVNRSVIHNGSYTHVYLCSTSFSSNSSLLSMVNSYDIVLPLVAAAMNLLTCSYHNCPTCVM